MKKKSKKDILIFKKFKKKVDEDIDSADKNNNNKES